MRARPLPNWLEQWARSDPDHAALICGERTVSFAALAGAARVAAGRLRRLGVRGGDRIAAVARNGLELVEVACGAMQLGAVLVPLSPRLGAAEIDQRLRDCAPALLCYDDSAVETVRNGGPPSIPRARLGGDALSGDAAWGELEAVDGATAAVDLSAPQTVIYTSGSSGRPKGVVLTYGNHFWSAAASAFNLGVLPDDRWLACLPFAHVGGLSILLRGLIYGTTTVIHPEFDPERVDRAIDERRVTIVSVVANMLQRMVEVRVDRPYPSWLRCVLLGGGPAPRALLEACAERRIPVAQTYGLTEAASQVATLKPRDALRKIGSAGQPLLPTEIRIVREGRSVGAGESGEIQVRGPCVSPGNLGEPAARRRGGWLATGDLGRLDEDGFLYVLGRCDDVIISGGENVHPAEVESALQDHPGVAEACAAGAPDERWGEAVVAFVRRRPGSAVSAEDLRRHARARLAAFKVPRYIHFVDDFPRTPSGKIARRKLAPPAASPEEPHHA
jgi:O-succinylbenzoic acid--CoA ligase